MSARCRCWCECDRLDPELSDFTSSMVVCMSCCLDRHKSSASAIDELTRRVEELERAIAKIRVTSKQVESGEALKWIEQAR